MRGEASPKRERNKKGGRKMNQDIVQTERGGPSPSPILGDPKLQHGDENETTTFDTQRGNELRETDQ